MGDNYMQNIIHKPQILFQTDFGVWGGASMYGMCKMVDPELQAWEMSHTVPIFDVSEASRRLTQTIPHWQEGTIFISVVDPGVGTARRACCALLNSGHYCLTPDNGTLTGVMDAFGIREIREIDESINRYPHTQKVSIFHGRDLFAYCAARLASGIIDFEGVGLAYPLGDVVRVANQEIPEPAGDVAGQLEGLLVEALGQEKNDVKNIVIINDYKHDGRLAALRGQCARICPGAYVYDLPLRENELGKGNEVYEYVKHYWPAGTVFVLAEDGKIKKCDKNPKDAPCPEQRI
jgi:S-adenosylmethionine hydrolase